MPASKKKLKDSLNDFFKNGENEYDNNYDEDFDESADSDDQASRNHTNENGSSRRLDRDDTHATNDSFGERKRAERGIDSSRYQKPKSTFSEPRRRIQSVVNGDSQKRRNQSGAGYSYGRSDAYRGGTGLTKKIKEGHKLFAPSKPKSDASVVRRVVSANRNRVNTLQNLILEQQQEIDQLKLENRDLKRSSRIQEKAIRKLNDDEAEIPMLVQKHDSEVHSLKENLKRQKERLEKSQEELRKRDIEIQRLGNRLQRAESIIKREELDERDQLQQKLLRLKENLTDKDSKITELERIGKLREKVHTRELKEKNDKYKKRVEELKKFEAMLRDLQDKLKAKEKELEVQNIYSHRIGKARLRDDEGQIAQSPDNAIRKLYDTVEKEDDQESVMRSKDTKARNSLEPKAVPVETMVSTMRKQENDHEKTLEEERNHQQLEEERRKLREMEEQLRRKEEEIKRVEKEREAARREEREKEERRLEEQRRREGEIEEMAERRAMEEMNKKREEERKMIKKLEQEKLDEEKFGERRAVDVQEDITRKLNEQKERRKVLENNANKDAETDAQSKKEILLARLKAIDDGKNVDEKKNDSFVNFNLKLTENARSVQKKKPIFLESSKAGDDKEDIIKHPPLDFRQKEGRRRGSKEYNFKDTDQNLHKGLPSHPDLIEGNSGKRDDLLFGEYNPSTNSAGKKRTARLQKDKPNEELFFNTKGERQKEKSDDGLFFDTKKAKEAAPAEYQLVNRTRTKSLSDEDDSHMFTIRNKKPEQIIKDGVDASKKKNTTITDGYAPSFSGKKSEEKADVFSPDSDPFATESPKYGRRRGQEKQSVLDGGILTDDSDKSQTKSKVNDLFGGHDKPKNLRTTTVDSVYSSVSDDIEEMTLT